jgi:hypothetical protein
MNKLLQQISLSHYNHSLQVFQTLTEEFTCVNVINNLYCGHKHIYTYYLIFKNVNKYTEEMFSTLLWKFKTINTTDI